MIIFDTETTGLVKPGDASIHLQPHIIEFYGMQVTPIFDSNKEIIGYDRHEDFESYVKPPIPIPEVITRITGIDNQTVSDAPDFLDIYPDIVELFLGETTAVGHNIVYDLSVLYFELKRNDLEFKFPWPQNWICTVEKSLPIQGRRLTLSNLHEIVTGNPHEGAHRAKADVEATFLCYQFLVSRGLIK